MSNIFINNPVIYVLTDLGRFGCVMNDLLLIDNYYQIEGLNDIFYMPKYWHSAN